MVDHSINGFERDPERAGAGSILTRWLAARWVLIALAVILAVLVAGSRLTGAEALAVFGVVGVATLAIPRRAEEAQRANSLALASDTSFEIAAGRLVDAVAFACIMLDERNTIRHVNAEALRRFPKLEAGRPLALVLRHPALLTAMEACRRTGLSQNVEVHLSQPNEAWFEAHLAIVSTATPDSGLDRDWMLISLNDITLQHRAVTMRADFIANASHELRTPLTSLLGFIDTLQGPAAKDPAAREKFLNIMRGQAERMARLINDLLSLSRIETHQHLTPTAPINLTTLLNEVGEGLQPIAKAAELELRLDFSVETPKALVLGERNELYEVFENLIDNAIKYGSGGSSVEVTLGPAKRLGYTYAVTVTDHGAGIPAEHVPRLTERFYRVDAESSRQKKGTGLGLAIVKHIVSRHRGILTIRSRLEEGTSVEVLLPGAPENG